MATLTPDTNFNIVNIPTLIKMKQQAGRAKDLDDIGHLRLIPDDINDK